MRSDENWKSSFQKYKQIEIEIGFGSSPVIPRLAESNADTLFIGVELLTHRCKTASRLNCFGNVVIINRDMRDMIMDIPDDSINGYYIFFPSPPTEMRLIDQLFQGELFRTLRSGGFVKIVTDHAQYFQEMIALFIYAKWSHIPWKRMPFIKNGSQLKVDTYWEHQHGAAYYFECVKRGI
jgi:tRNA (guanine-N7-)-methyltransferase